jgi:hypothetical protein
MRTTKTPESLPTTDPTDPVLDELLHGEPRANQLGQMRAVLQERRREIEADLQTLLPDDPRHATLGRKLNELKTQIRALAEEEAISQFVEDSVRATLSRPARPGMHDDNEFEIF